MSEFDVMPYVAAGGQHCQIGSGRIDATDVYEKGDVVAIDVDGSIIEAGDEAAVDGSGAPGTTGTVGVALAGTADLVSAFSSDATQATAESEGVQVPYASFQRGDQFVLPAARFTEADDTTFDGTVAASNVGDLASLRTAGTTWGVCIHASSSNRHFRIVKLIDADGKDAVAAGTTIAHIVIRVEV